jgi:hypothetical protein
MEPVSIITLILSLASLIMHIRHFKSDCCGQEAIHIDLATDGKN